MVHHFACNGGCAVSTGLGSHIDNDRPWLHGLNHLLGDELWGLLARNECSGYDDIHFLALLCKQRHLGLDKLLGHLFCVSSFALARLFYIDSQELGAHRLGLFGHCCPRVEDANNGSQVLRVSSGRQTSHPSTNHQRLRWRYTTRGSDLTTEEPAEVMGGLDDGSVASNIGHRAQSIERLSTTDDSRNRIESKHSSFPPLQSLQELLVHGWLDVAHQVRSLFQ
mmetsp:Transcript_13972/g.35235  ORF Transcript_13972/g.35235 Transcript_13972/m.35235 type:complete len:223 (+) Transcript_13972:144-812(+)